MSPYRRRSSWQLILLIPWPSYALVGFPLLLLAGLLCTGGPLLAQQRTAQRADYDQDYPHAPYTIQLTLGKNSDQHQGKWLHLWARVGRRLQPEDSVRIRGQRVTFEGVRHPGLFKLGLYPMQGAELVLGKASRVRYKAAFENGRVKLTMQGGSNPDHKAYDLMMQARQAFQRGYRQIQQGSSQGGRTLTSRQQRRVDSLSRDFNYKLDAIQNKYPETYVGEVFCPLARNIVPPMAMSTRRDRRTYMLTHYFDYTDFSDARIVYNDLFSAKIQQYLQSQAASQGMAAFEPLTDSLLQRAAQNQRVEDFMMNHLFELFDLRGPSNMIPYLRKHHLDRLKYPTEKTLTILQRAKALEPGKPAPDLAYQDTSGTVRSLRDNLGEEVTLLYVWSSNCDHCLKHTPDVHELYQRYKRQGFAVYAVGLERNAESWKEQIRQMGLSWTNVSELKGYESSVTTKYGVRSTPSLILIDGQGRILARNVHPNNLKAQLQKYLEG